MPIITRKGKTKMEIVLVQRYKNGTEIFDEYVITDLSLADRAEFVRQQFMLELAYPEGCTFSIEAQVV